MKCGQFDPLDYQEGYFDYVTMDQVIEHVVDPVETLKGVSRILKPGGRLIASTPNAQGWGAAFFGRKWLNWHAPYHLHFFSRRSFHLAAEKAGLEIDSVKCITPSFWLYFQQLHILAYPRPGAQSVFWVPTQKKKLSAGLRFVKIFIICFNRVKLNHLITRFFDGIGLGDNKLFFLSNKKPRPKTSA